MPGQMLAAAVCTGADVPLSTRPTYTNSHIRRWQAKNAPHFGIAHALCLGLAPWLAAEVPYLVESGAVRAKS